MASERSCSDAVTAHALINADRRRGRGARSNRVGRYEAEQREAFDDGWESLAELAPFKTQVHRETAKSIIASNDAGLR